MIARSLTSRLLIALVATQVGAIMVAMLVFPFVAPFVSFNDIADTTFRNKIVPAIIRNQAGELSIQPTEELKRYCARRPGAAFAVMSLDNGRMIKGADLALGQLLEQVKSLPPRPGGNLITNLPGGATLVVTASDTSMGRLLFATTGNRFYLEDWPSLAASFAPILLPIYGPVIFGALVLIPMIVRMVTRPLRRLAAGAELVSPGALQVRLDESGLSPELQLLARAVNGALERVAQGVARQRLYAANAAHELRTPMAILGLHIDLLPPSEHRTRLQSDVARIRTLVEQLVTVARLGQNHVAMDEPIDLATLLRDVVADRAPIAIRDGRDLEFFSDPTAYWVLGNRQALFSALANIVDNAIRAEPAGGTVSVLLTADGQVLVRDHGPGIAAEHRALVFEPFWRGTTAPGGAGLGLAIVKEIADRHHIEIDIVATEQGGATFRLRFGAQTARPAPVSVRQ